MLTPAEEIKSKLDIVEIIGEYINLRPAGSNFRGLCPFHQEKTPSFMVSQEKQIWRCFGCNKGGDVLAFVMEMEGLEFREVLERLAPRAGVELKNFNNVEHSRRGRLHEILKVAAAYYHQVLVSNPNNHAVVAVSRYLAERGLKPETISLWNLGYSPDSWDDLMLFLKKRNFTDEEILLSGLGAPGKNDRGAYNRFRDRIMFPITDAVGQVAGFTARLNPASASKTEIGGKYINSPQTAVYDKSRILFGLDKAKAAIKNQNLAIIVEGQMDVISCHQAGFTNVVASSGTALTADQVKLLKRYSDHVAFALDMDAAGQLASDRGVLEAFNQELVVKVIVIPFGKDPDDCVRSDPAAFGRAITEAKEILDYFLDKDAAGLDLKNPENNRRARQDLAKKILDFWGSNRAERDFWIKRVSQRLDIDEAEFRADLKKKIEQRSDLAAPVPAPVAPDSNEAPVKSSWEEKATESLLALLVQHPAIYPYISSNIKTEELTGLDAQEFYKSLIIYYNDDTNEDNVNYAGLKHRFSASKKELTHFLDKMALLGEKDFSHLTLEQAQGETVKLIDGLRKNSLHRQSVQLQRQLSQAETDGDMERAVAIMEELRLLKLKARP
jgi:DNA primase